MVEGILFGTLVAAGLIFLFTKNNGLLLTCFVIMGLIFPAFYLLNSYRGLALVQIFLSLINYIALKVLFIGEEDTKKFSVKSIESLTIILIMFFATIFSFTIYDFSQQITQMELLSEQVKFHADEMALISAGIALFCYVLFQFNKQVES